MATGRGLSPNHAAHKLSLNFLICSWGLEQRSLELEVTLGVSMPTENIPPWRPREGIELA